jgi:hypothetical protein
MQNAKVAIDRTEGKRNGAVAGAPEAKAAAKTLKDIPRGAGEFKKQIEDGLDGDPRAAGNARAAVRLFANSAINSRRKHYESRRPLPLWSDYVRGPD